MSAESWQSEATNPDGAAPSLVSYPRILVVKTDEGPRLMRSGSAAAFGPDWTTIRDRDGSEAAIARSARLIPIAYRRRWREVSADQGENGGKPSGEWWAWEDGSRVARPGYRLQGQAQVMCVPATGNDAQPVILTARGYAGDDLWTILRAASGVADEATRKAGRPIGAWQWAIPVSATVREIGRSRNKIATVKVDTGGAPLTPDAAWCDRSKAAASLSRSPSILSWALEWRDTPTAGADL